MVSLNEKRSKIRYIVQNKTEWVDDGNKFGKKMLEKMGWTSGVGLGKNEDGRTEHIQMKFKDNLKGVGFVNGKYDETWIEHSQSFDSVLQQLQQSHPSSSLSSLNNFNQNVQQTKTRFTYKKQSSGKDLTSRSNDELDCIFGWNKTNRNDKQQSHQDKEIETISDEHYVTSTQTIQDYFKDKSNKKAQRVYQQSQSLNNDQIDSESLSCEQSISNDPINEIIDQQNESIQEKRKKNKRDQQTEETLDDFDQNEKRKKKKEENQTIIEDPYSGSNLSQLEGYQGWNIDSSFQDIIKKKEKQKKRKK